MGLLGPLIAAIRSTEGAPQSRTYALMLLLEIAGFDTTNETTMRAGRSGCLDVQRGTRPANHTAAQDSSDQSQGSAGLFRPITGHKEAVAQMVAAGVGYALVFAVLRAENGVSDTVKWLALVLLGGLAETHPNAVKSAINPTVDLLQELASCSGREASGDLVDAAVKVRHHPQKCVPCLLARCIRLISECR